MHKFYILLVLPFILSACLPAIFTAATGSTVAVAKDRSLGETIDDTKIAASINTKLMKSNFRELYTKINVTVVQGRVLYTGLIQKEEDALTAIEIAWSNRGVKEVINELKVDENSSHFDLLQFTRDTMITSQIKSKIFINRDIKFVNYTVITIKDIVYLFGIARGEEELEKVANIASKVHGVQKVISHVKMNPIPEPRESSLQETGAL